MLSSLRHAARSASALARGPARMMSTSFDAEFGSKVFSGAVADKYLKQQGESAALLEDHTWTTTKADKVAAAILAWGKDNNATVYAHWFQPMGANSVRPGMTGMVANYAFTFGADGKPLYKFTAEELLKGESDGSSYPNGGLRATHTAGGYTILDPSSPVFIRGDTIHIPTVFISWEGFSTEGVQSNIGLEQEFFLVPRDAYARRLDLQMTGRTVLGRNAPRGQAIQEEAFMMGIPLRTRHREVAPNQYEMAPYFGSATQQIDQNIMVMQICEEVSARFGLACLMQEKPFAGVNGSGKHNNWSIGTQEGINLLNVNQVTKATGNPAVFPVIMAALIAGADRHGDLMRASIACPGNDFRLGACEAPPAIMSTYIGPSLTQFLDDFRNGKATEYKPVKKMIQTGVDIVADFEVPAEDRNRTSPFPYGGHRFEFRAVGSTQNVSFVNTVLCALTAEAFKEFSDNIEAGQTPQEVAKKALHDHWKVIYNGDGYDPEWPAKATKQGVWRIDSGVDAINEMSSPKNLKLFADLNILNKTELEARRDVNLTHYVGMIEMEALCMIDMIVQQIVPALKEAEQSTVEVKKAVDMVQKGLAAMHHETGLFEKATLARNLRLETMIEARVFVDTAEGECPAHLWPLATYKELLFLDANQDANGQTL